mmetsp:Transcript_19421/g.34439  ORF Transcript_19421/g.34439 Transcript_19421/m.34439 type:complete len:89 (-) Transcript_19421:795-1061(-)
MKPAPWFPKKKTSHVEDPLPCALCHFLRYAPFTSCNETTLSPADRLAQINVHAGSGLSFRQRKPHLPSSTQFHPEPGTQWTRILLNPS